MTKKVKHSWGLHIYDCSCSSISHRNMTCGGAEVQTLVLVFDITISAYKF